MKKLLSTISRYSLLTIYKTFVSPIYGYARIIYDRPLNESFENKFKMVRYHSALVITGVIKPLKVHRVTIFTRSLV